MLTAFEIRYLLLEPFLPPLYQIARSQVLAHLPRGSRTMELLDVGGRKSHTTIGVPARVTITDVPRTTSLQHDLNLGFNEAIRTQIQGRRSNVHAVVYDDMTDSALPDAAFDFVLSVEVIEHVEKDALFVSHIARVMRPGGVFFLTTPNGDFVANTNPDHKRHYRKKELEALLGRYFQQVRVWYGVPDSPWRRRGLKSWSLRRPIRTVTSMGANWIDGQRSRFRAWRSRAMGTHHLFALCRDPIASESRRAAEGSVPA